MHEQSRTIERDGQYFNISGVTGQTLEGPFPSLDIAVDSARRRSGAFDSPPPDLFQGPAREGESADPMESLRRLLESY